MTYSIRIIGLADGRRLDGIDGAWVVDCDVDGRQGRGSVIVTREARKARRFDHAHDAWAYWRRESTVVPTRPDGKPNRPLTAYTISVEPNA